MAASQDLSQPTQRMLDPRRVGQNGSGLPARELTDILLLLHPVTPAATKIVANAAKNAPQHVLFTNFFDSYAQISENIEEQETIIIGENGERSPNYPLAPTDIALRLSSIDTLKSKSLGFVFGRNIGISDIVFGQDSGRRISNKHFRIFLNENGIVMLQDISTNGTMVDNVLLIGKTSPVNATRMLAQGSTITITHPDPNEIVEFIVKVPSRGRLQPLFEEAQHQFLSSCSAANGQGEAPRPLAKRPYRATMKWDGGDEYKILGELGKGAFATVHQLATKMDGTLLAAKELEKKRFMKNGQLDKKIDNEMKIMEGLRHPNIVEFKGHHDEGDYLYIIMEFVPHGDLQHYLKENGPIDESMARPLAEQILSALSYLHRAKITHRDIKPDNILIASFDPYQFKISDFGLSKAVNHDETFLKTFCGTLLYCAPEVFPDFHGQHTKKRRRGAKQYNAYSSSVDIWSFGGVLWFALCNQPPFKGIADTTGRAMYENIMATQLDPTPLRERGVSEACIDLLCKMLQVDPAARPTEADCLNHPWLNPDGAKLNASILQSIYEDDESLDAEQQLSQLSIRQEIPESEDEDDILEDEEFEKLIDVRQSKRIRADPRFPRNQARDYDAESSVTPSFLAEANQVEVIEDDSFMPLHQPMTGRQRLFGEIGASVLQESGVMHERLTKVISTEAVPGSRENEHFSTAGAESGAQAPDQGVIPQLDGHVSSGLFGAASMVRDLHMASSDSNVSEGHSPNEPATPKTPEVAQSNSLEHPEKAGSQVSEPTPRPKPTLNRQISLPKTASHWFDPFDPSTHTLEYASKKSGFDFVAQARRDAEAGAPSMEDTVRNSETGQSSEIRVEVSHGSPENILPSLPGELHIMPPPRRLGKLVSTPDSFAPGLILNIDRDITSWGRLPDCSVVYHDASDTRIPKFAFAIIWHTAESLKKGQPLSQFAEDWVSLPDLHVGIVTRAKNGITINGTLLKEKDNEGRQLYGRLHTGDIIQVFQDPTKNKHLRFKCEFRIGSGQKPRPAGHAFRVSHK